MDTWIVHILNLPNVPRILATEVQADNITNAIAAAVLVTNSHANNVISARLKAPIVVE